MNIFYHKEENFMFFLNVVQAPNGTGSQTSPEEVKNEWGHILVKDEEIKVAYKTFRDYFIFTTKRLILSDAQGVTGKKIIVRTIPYNKIISFGVETAGVLDFYAELYIWLSGNVGGDSNLGANTLHYFKGGY